MSDVFAGQPHHGLGHAAVLARNWWLVVLRGVIAILFGVTAFVWPGITLGVLVLLFGAYMVVDGVFAIASGVRAAARHERWGALIAEGALDLVVGAIAFAMPIATVFAFIVLAGAWAIISGGLMLWASLRLAGSHRWLAAIGGAISLAWGLLLFLQPIAGALVLTWWIGAYALFFGAALIALGLRLRALRARLV
jgi:uncharacterized membrane protein HdeD (DUF308 family)